MFECSFFSWNFTRGKKRFQVKFFYLTQLAYWLHALPELYFQKVRKVSNDNRSYACARSARDDAQSYSVLRFPGGAFPSAAVHLSVSAARRRTLFIKVSVQDIKHLQIQAIPEGTLAFIDKISPKMELSWGCDKPSVSFLLQHESSGFGASLSPVRLRVGIPHRQTLLLHWWESSENVSGPGTALSAWLLLFSLLWCVFQVWHVGGQLCVYTDGDTDPDVPGSGLRFGSCREPGTGRWDRQL